MIVPPQKLRWLRLAALPLAAVLLGVAFQALSPHGLWASPEMEEVRPGHRAEPGRFPKVGWPEVATGVAAGEILLVDARSWEAFEAGHLPGAVSLPSHAFDGMLEAFLLEHGPGRRLVIYCANADCDLSTDLARRLADDYGFADISLLRGGYLEWRRQAP